MNKNLINQILWIIAIGIIIWFGFANYNERNPKQVVVPQETESQNRNIEKLCMERAIEESDKMEKFLTKTENPYLQISDEQIQKTKEGIKNEEYKECMDIWTSPIEEK